MDRSELAALYGIKGFHVKSLGELEGVLNESFKYDGAVSVDVISESEVADLLPDFLMRKITSN